MNFGGAIDMDEPSNPWDGSQINPAAMAMFQAEHDSRMGEAHAEHERQLADVQAANERRMAEAHFVKREGSNDKVAIRLFKVLF
jgi:uncharacterized membrane protein YqiK